MKKITIGIIVAVCLVVLVGAVTIVPAASNSLTLVLKEAGRTLGALLYGRMADDVVVSEGRIGAAQSAGVTQSTQKIAQVALNVGTTTPGSLLNNSGQDRVMVGTGYWYESSASASTANGGAGPASALLTADIATSSDPYPVSATMLFADDMKFPTSTQGSIDQIPQLTNTTTPTEMTSNVARIWLDGEYLNLRLSATITQSTSTGFFWVEYYLR